MKNKKVPINKGNYSLESPERELLFEKFRGEGWESCYLEYRQHWTDYAKNQIVSEYPLLVDLELASICNLKCPMCYTITDEFKKRVKTKLLDFELFKKVIDEVGGKVPAIRLSLRGEPMLHPKFIDCIVYAKKKGIREVSFLTNGSRLTKVNFLKIMKAGADWITISIDGIGKCYEEIRKPLVFKETLQKIIDIKRIKNDCNSHKPIIKIQSIWPTIRENTQEYFDTFVPYVDLIAFNPLIDYLGNDVDIVYEQNFLCPQHYQRLVIGADGLAMMCSNDDESLEIMGDANTESIYTIWHGKRLNKMRKRHKQKNGFLQIPVCRKCYLPRKTEDSEKVVVNGRKVIIKNYINRVQNIGQ